MTGFILDQGKKKALSGLYGKVKKMRDERGRWRLDYAIALLIDQKIALSEGLRAFQLDEKATGQSMMIERINYLEKIAELRDAIDLLKSFDGQKLDRSILR